MKRTLSILKKKHLIATTIGWTSVCSFVCIFFLSSCFHWDSVQGEGGSVTDSRSVGTFRSVDVGGDIEVYLMQGTAGPLRVEGQANILNVLETYVHDNELRIKYRTGVIVRAHAPVRIYITIPELQSVTVSGSATARSQSDWNVDDFKTCVSGSGKIEMTLRRADDVHAIISGSGNTYLRGDCQSYEVDISGSGSMYGFEFTTRNADLRISGSGSCELTATSQMNVRISGSGTVRYRGNPVIDSHISGSGRIINAN